LADFFAPENLKDERNDIDPVCCAPAARDNKVLAVHNNCLLFQANSDKECKKVLLRTFLADFFSLSPLKI
jgi:hypothetical protein